MSKPSKVEPSPDPDSQIQAVSQQLANREAELAVLNRVQQGLAARLNLDQIFELVGEELVEIFDGFGVALYLTEPDSDTSKVMFMYEEGKRHYPEPVEPGPIGTLLINSKEPLMVSTTDEFQDIGAITIEGTANSLSGIFAPLIAGGEAIGALNIESTEKEYAFDEGDYQLVKTIAGSLSMALDNARLFDETERLLEQSEQRAAELSIINTVQQALVAELDMEGIYTAVGEELCSIFKTQIVTISRFDPKAKQVEGLFAYEKGSRERPGPIPFNSLYDWAYQQLSDGNSIVINGNFPELASQFKDYKVPHGEMPVSLINVAIPRAHETDVIEAISLQDVDGERQFTESDLRLLKTLASSMGVALENAELLEQTQARAAELQIINSVQGALASKLDIEGIYKEVGLQLRSIFGSQIVTLGYADLDQKMLHYRFGYEKGMDLQVKTVPFNSLYEDLVGQLANGDPFVLNKQYPEYAAQFEDYRVPIGEMPLSILVVPIPRSSQNEIVEFINLADVDGERTFGESDIRLLETLAGSISVALENARLLTETEKRAKELAIINTVQAALAAKRDIQSIYDSVGDKLHEVFAEAQVVDILNYDKDENLFYPRYVIEKGQRFEVEPWQVRGFRKHVIETGEPLVINENMEQMARQYDNEWVVLGEKAKSWLGMPLIVSGEVTGVISLQHIDRENAFSESDVNLLQTLANSMSVALESARLFDESQRLLKETEQRAAELQIINSVQQGLSSKMEIREIYDLVGDRLLETFESDTTFIAFLNEARDQLHFPYYNDRGTRSWDQSRKYADDGVFGELARRRRPLLFNTPEEYYALLSEADTLPTPSPGSEQDLNQSNIIAPIFRDNQVVGAISVQSYQEHAFNPNDLTLLETLANAMSVSLDNAQLFDETQRLLQETEQRAAELQIINSVQRGLASKLEMQGIYELIGDKIREIFNADTTFIAFHDAEQNAIFAPYYNDKGVVTRQTYRPFGTGLTEKIILEGKPLKLDTAKAMQAAGSFEIASPGSDEDLNQSFLGVPIFQEGNVIGATSVQSYQPRAFDENDLTLLQTITNSMSVALENARLFDETERLLQETEQRAAELATINAVGQALVTESELDALIDLIGKQIHQTFEADIVYVALLDEETGRIQFPFSYGETFEPLSLGEGLTSKIIETGEPLLINRDIDQRRDELGVAQVGKRASSYLGVPIRMGGQTLGVLSVQSTTEEGRFHEGDLDLLNTIAANVGAAIRNAQLFDEIKRQKQYYEAVIEYSPAAIVLLDLEANVTGWNPAAERLFGYAKSEALGENIDSLVAGTEELYQEAVAYSKQAMREHEIYKLAKRTRKDGTVVEVDLAGVPVSVDGQRVGFIAIYHDVTELQQARQEAEQANQAKSTFLANMSHELRTPLNAIIGFTRIVRRKGEDSLPDKQVENLDKVLVSADHLLSLINTVLDISKIEAGRMEVSPAEFNLEPLLEQVGATVQPLLKSNVEYSVQMVGQMPAIYSDQEKIKQILINLVSNAAKFTHEGEIRVEIEQVGSQVEFAVSDSGIGISQEALSRIFEEFQQADSSTTREYGGTGLGLAISRRLARLLGGDLVATSQEGVGSTFTLIIPHHFSGASSAEKPESPERRLASSLEDGRQVVLVIDDDPNVHDLLKENLGDAGYHVVCAADGREGLRLARRLQPFAITLDIMMPQKDGWQVLHELKTDARTRAIPVIMLTIVDKQSLGYKLGADDFLIKPLDENAVIASLNRLRHADKEKSSWNLLVVDDDPTIADLVRQLTEPEGIAVSSAADGKEAIEQIKRQPPDVMLLDLLMPGMDGFQVLEMLRQQEFDFPIIILTAKSLTKDEREKLEGEAAQIIRKNGLDQDQLLRELRRTFSTIATASLNSAEKG